MPTGEPLKLIVIYDANRNEYSVSAHNQNAEDAKRFADRWNPHLIPGCSLIALDQPRRHQTADPHSCQACRDIVARSAHLSPNPKFKRRMQP